MTRFLVAILIVLFLAGCASHSTGGVYHTVKKGQTLYSISRVYGVNEHYLARINGISDPTQLQAGEKIYIPGATEVKWVPITVKDAPPPKVAKPASKPKTTQKATTASKPTQQKATKPETTASSKPKVVKGKFIWPVRGKIVKKFGGSGAKASKGLEIAVDAGTTVSASAAGKVIYSGDGITGYGNLVIVRHDENLFTVYGYNQKNLVSSGAFVSKGEKIALAGKPPSGGKSRVYFEIRHGKKPVNPIYYLP